MATWQLAVLLLALVWALQSAGVWMQMRHYRDALGDIEQRFNSGFVGTGFVRGRLAKGTIALVVVSDTLVVDRVAVMAGRSVFAKFKSRREFDGLTLDALREAAATLVASRSVKADRSLGEALTKAIEQIDAVRAKKAQVAGEGNAVQRLLPSAAADGEMRPLTAATA
jgi:glucitol operon activator protein